MKKISIFIFASLSLLSIITPASNSTIRYNAPHFEHENDFRLDEASERGFLVDERFNLFDEYKDNTRENLVNDKDIGGEMEYWSSIYYYYNADVDLVYFLCLTDTKIQAKKITDDPFHVYYNNYMNVSIEVSTPNSEACIINYTPSTTENNGSSSCGISCGINLGLNSKGANISGNINITSTVTENYPHVRVGVTQEGNKKIDYRFTFKDQSRENEGVNQVRKTTITLVKIPNYSAFSKTQNYIKVRYDAHVTEWNFWFSKDYSNTQMMSYRF